MNRPRNGLHFSALAPLPHRALTQLSLDLIDIRGCLVVQAVRLGLSD